jgi:predicted DNA-binding protein YlxM (UPF0122 family)
MTDKAELSLLLDYYGAFLTERQRNIAAMNADLDMSLSEIADEIGVSRQAVRDHLARAAAELNGCEEKLGLVKRDLELRRIAEKLKTACEEDTAEALRAKSLEAAESILALTR